MAQNYACIVESSTSITGNPHLIAGDKLFVLCFAGGSIVVQNRMPA